jgi:hypothetical protein
MGRLDGDSGEAGVRRVVVLGGTGWFGRAIVEQLARLGVPAVAASRSGDGRLRIDANDPDSLRAGLRPGDVVIDAAGPYHLRNTALIETAIDLGCDVIDLNDYLGYARQVLRLAPQIQSAGVRVLPSCSTVSAVSAAAIRHSGIETPTRITGILAPATRHTANAGAARSLLRSVGNPISVWRDGRLQTATGWRESRKFSMGPSLCHLRGHLYETADAILLPKVWPSLRDVSMYVDTNTPGMNWLLSMASRSRPIHRLVEKQLRMGSRLARWWGSKVGGVGYEIEAADARVRRYALAAERSSYLTAVAPAILAGKRLAEEGLTDQGLILPDKQVDAAELFQSLASAGISLCEVGGENF